MQDPLPSRAFTQTYHPELSPPELVIRALVYPAAQLPSRTRSSHPPSTPSSFNSPSLIPTKWTELIRGGLDTTYEGGKVIVETVPMTVRYKGCSSKKLIIESWIGGSITQSPDQLSGQHSHTSRLVKQATSRWWPLGDEPGSCENRTITPVCS